MPAAMVSQSGFPFDSIGSAADNGSNGGGSNVGIAVGATSSTSSSPEVKVRVVRRDRDSKTFLTGLVELYTESRVNGIKIFRGTCSLKCHFY